MPSMSRWLVGSSSSSRSGAQRERERERRALALAARRRAGRRASSSPKRCRNSTSRASTRQRSRSSAMRSKRRRAARGSRAATTPAAAPAPARQHDAQPVAPLDLAVVERQRARDHLEQRRLAGAVAADEPDALAVVDGEAGAVEQRMQAERELGVLEGEERHGRGGSHRDRRAEQVAIQECSRMQHPVVYSARRVVTLLFSVPAGPRLSGALQAPVR